MLVKETVDEGSAFHVDREYDPNLDFFAQQDRWYSLSPN